MGRIDRYPLRVSMMTSPNRSVSTGRWMDTILLAVTPFSIAAFLIREIVDPDTWWQVGIGRDILERFSVPAKDHFSAVAFGRDYHDSHWLFQVVMGFADRLAGMAGVDAVMIGL